MRGKGEGSIFKDGRGLWTAKIELPSHAGKRRRKVIRSKSKAVVLAKLRELQQEKDRTGGDLQTKSRTVEQWMNDWYQRVAVKQVAPTTANTYRSLIDNQIIPTVGSIRLDKLTPADVARLSETILEKGLSQRTALQSHRILSTALKAAESEGIIPRNVGALTKAPRLAKGDARALTVDEALRVLRVATDDPYGSMWATLLLTGARQGELLGLERSRVSNVIDLSWQLQRIPWRHGCKTNCGRLPKNCPQRTQPGKNDWESRELYGSLVLSRPKTEAGKRIIPLVPQLKETLEHHMAAAGPNEYGLVWTYLGKPIDPRKHLRMWHDVLTRAKVPLAGIHATRHTAVDLMYAAGIPEDLITQLVGHTTRMQSRSYKTNANIPRLTEAMEKMAAQLTRPDDARSDTPAITAR